MPMTMMMMMKGLLTTLTCLISARFAETGKFGVPRAICPNLTIEAVEGESVHLPCYLDPPDSMESYAVDWKRRDLNKLVYSYRHKQGNLQTQMDQYRGRASLNHEDLRRGILTLRLSSVQLSDSGPYRCFVSKLITSCNTALVIVTKDQQNRTKRDDSSTARPPLDELNNPDGGNMVLGMAVLASTAAVFIIFVLVLMRNSCKALVCDPPLTEKVDNHPDPYYWAWIS